MHSRRMIFELWHPFPCRCRFEWWLQKFLLHCPPSTYGYTLWYFHSQQCQTQRIHPWELPNDVVHQPLPLLSRLQRKLANLLAFLFAQGTFLNQALSKKCWESMDGYYFFCRVWVVCKGRLIQFVVTITTITNLVDNDIRSPLVTPLHCSL